MTGHRGQFYYTESSTLAKCYLWPLRGSANLLLLQFFIILVFYNHHIGILIFDKLQILANR